MSKSKFLGVALLFAPIALLSGCGGAPDYQESEYTFQETPLYTDNGGGFDFGMDTPDEDQDGDGVPDAIDQTDDSGNNGGSTGGWGRAQGAKPSISRFCKRNRCLAAPKYSLPKDWRAVINKRIPEPAPGLNSQIVYNDNVYVVTEQVLNARGIVTNLKVKQIGALKARAN